MSPTEYENFLSNLYSLCDLKREKEIISTSQALEVVMQGIKSIRNDQYRLLFEHTGASPESIQADLEAFFYPVFNNLGPDFYSKIKSVTGDFFYVRKSFQLSHLQRIFHDYLTNLGEFGDCFYLQLYTDYYETLTNRLIGLHREFFDLEERRLYQNSASFHKELMDKQPIDFFYIIKLNEDLRSYRNSFSHGQFICSEQTISIMKDPRNAVESDKVTELQPIDKVNYFPRLRSLMVFQILFSTEFDLRIFQSVQQRCPINMVLWGEYLDIYCESWKTQERIAKMNHAHP